MVSASACTWVILAQIYGREKQMFIYVDLEKKITQKSNGFYKNKANVSSNRFQTFFLSYISASQIGGRSAEGGCFILCLTTKMKCYYTSSTVSGSSGPGAKSRSYEVQPKNTNCIKSISIKQG